MLSYRRRANCAIATSPVTSAPDHVMDDSSGSGRVGAEGHWTAILKSRCCIQTDDPLALPLMPLRASAIADAGGASGAPRPERATPAEGGRC